MHVYTINNVKKIEKPKYKTDRLYYVREKDLQKTVNDLIKVMIFKGHGFAYHPSEQAYIPDYKHLSSGTKGLPDNLGWIKKKRSFNPFAIELKVGKNKLTESQIYIRDILIKAGCIYAVCTCFEEVRDFFNIYFGLEV